LHEHIFTHKAEDEENCMLESMFISKTFIASCFYFHIWREPNAFGLGCLTDSYRGEKAS